MSSLFTGILAAGLLFAAPALAQNGSSSNGPSFDCTGAKGNDAVICGNAELSALDRDLAKFYALSKTSAFGSGPSNELAMQRQWLKSRDCKGDTAAQVKCLKDNYQGRLIDLAEVLLFAAHDDAMAVLRRNDARIAAIYEAQYRYVTVDDAAKRSAAVAQALTPFYAGLEAEDKASLKDDKLDTPALAAAHFTDFVVEAGVRLGNQTTWSCTALIRRPEILDAEGSQFGSTMDNFIPGDDCGVTLPPMPHFDDLVQSAFSEPSLCDGTLRYAAYRDGEQVETATRLHRTSYWKSDPLDADGARLQAKFRKAHAALEAQAIRELTDYYVQWFKLTPAQAATDAKRAVDAQYAHLFVGC